jgi:glycosyltransferase involved in cell wall biosynthesis
LASRPARSSSPTLRRVPPVTGPAGEQPLTQTVSVVVPVYLAGPALVATVDEVLGAAASFDVGPQVRFELDELILVVDNPGLAVEDRNAVQALEQRDPRIRTIWLTRNFGQHAATVAGIVSTNGDWVVTMDEDGQHDPVQIPRMARTAAAENTPLVYARPTNPPPHGVLRNVASAVAKMIFRLLSGAREGFHSFRLMEGSIARSACAYIGESVYLDVAMRWSFGEPASCPMRMRDELAHSSYRLRQLLSHFWRMVLSTGTRPLRLIAFGGVLVALVGIAAAVFVIEQRLTGAFHAPGWASVMVVLLILDGGLLITLAVVAEYVGFAVRNSIGKPLYVKAENADARALWTLQAALAAGS